MSGHFTAIQYGTSYTGFVFKRHSGTPHFLSTPHLDKLL